MNKKPPKKYIVGSWFYIEETFEDKEIAKRAVETKKEHERYKEVRLYETDYQLVK